VAWRAYQRDAAPRAELAGLRHAARHARGGPRLVDELNPDRVELSWRALELLSFAHRKGKWGLAVIGAATSPASVHHLRSFFYIF
jgi:hypothetical protein